MVLARSIFYQIIYGIWAVLMALIFLPSLTLPHKASLFVAQFWSASVFLILRYTTGLTYKVENQSLIPDGPVIYASKHQSTWDTLFYPYEIKNAAIVLKKELYLIPFFGWYAKKYGNIAVNRKSGSSALRKMVREAKIFVLSGRSIVVFPEGTRTRPGEKHKYHSGVAALYKNLDLPVVPVALNSGLFWPRRHLIRKPGIITLRYLTPILPGLSREAFMSKLETEIEAAQIQINQSTEL